LWLPRSSRELPRTFNTKNTPLGMSHEPAVNAPDLVAAVSSSNYRERIMAHRHHAAPQPLPSALIVVCLFEEFGLS